MERALRSVCASCTRKLLLQQKRQQQLILATATRRNTPLRISHHRPYSSIKAAQQPEKIQEINENSELSAEGTLDKANKELEKILTDAAVYEVHPERTLQKVLRIIQELRDRNIPFNLETYERLQSAYAKRGMLSEMMPLLQEMAANDVEPSTRIFHNALQLAAWMSNPTVQVRILAEMGWWGAEMTRTTYENLLRCARNNGELERMLEILKEMVKRGLKPTLESYDGAIDLALHYHEPETAMELLIEAMNLREFRTRHRSMTLKVLRGAAMDSCHSIVKKVWQMAVEEKQFDPDEGLCTLVLHVAGRYGDPDLGNKAIIKINQMGFPWRSIYFPPLIQAYSSKSDWKSSFRLLHLMRTVGIPPTKETAMPIAKALGRDIPAIRKALLTLHDLAKENELDVVAVNVVIHSFAYNGLYDQCMSTYYLAPSWGVDVNIETVDALLDACIHNQEVENGVSIYERHTKDGLQPTASTLSKMVVLICTQEDYEEAFKYLELMKQNGLKPLRGAYYRLVKKLAKANDPRLPWLLDEMQSCQYEMPTHIQAYIDQHCSNAAEEKDADAVDHNM